jgi:hypothetical protein
LKAKKDQRHKAAATQIDRTRIPERDISVENALKSVAIFPAAI